MLSRPTSRVPVWERAAGRGGLAGRSLPQGARMGALSRVVVSACTGMQRLTTCAPTSWPKHSTEAATPGTVWLGSQRPPTCELVVNWALCVLFRFKLKKKSPTRTHRGDQQRRILLGFVCVMSSVGVV